MNSTPAASICPSAAKHEPAPPREKRSTDQKTKASNFLIARNVVYRTTADGIHMTTGSNNGRVACNVVRENGDDMIAVVEYGNGEPQMGAITIEDNDVAGTYWGRGITVVGGRDVTIRRNKIALTTHAAGIYIAAEEGAFKTRNVRNVLVEDNEILNIQNTTPAYNPINNFTRTHHAAIEVTADGAREIGGVLFRRNTVNGSGFDGIRVRGGVCGLGFSLMTMTSINMLPMRLQYLPNDQCAAIVGCSGIRYQGADIQNDKCSNTPLPTVTGSPQG